MRLTLYHQPCSWFSCFKCCKQFESFIYFLIESLKQFSLCSDYHYHGSSRRIAYDAGSFILNELKGRLLAQNILVRHPDTIETAGYMNILFSDKTGTIAEGKLPLLISSLAMELFMRQLMRVLLLISLVCLKSYPSKLFMLLV